MTKKLIPPFGDKPAQLVEVQRFEFREILSGKHRKETEIKIHLAVGLAETYEDLAEYSSGGFINEIIPDGLDFGSKISDDSFGEVARERVEKYLMGRWIMARRHEIVRNAVFHAIDEIINNDYSIEFTDEQAKFSINDFTHCRG